MCKRIAFLTLVVALLSAPLSSAFADSAKAKHKAHHKAAPAVSSEQRDKPEEVMSASCPYTCNSAGYSKWGCSEWKKGGKCYIGPKGGAKAKAAAKK